ncbi:MAG: translation elongation factor Ts [Kiritimatiellae bacterium]|jgi:elongation factor Ts|nr:translation elongation factor Ts [Kiritimatiellia bacterium]MDD4340941.1 translation elongation factor Ts [Kiritimatiellia bacterium]MDY0148646.1 translation elongation factor Ts [Kiritimatiellia bacterium]
MADITASMVKELREETGVGMMECKKALVETNGDKAAAIKVLREAGMAIAAKRADRATKQGIIAASVSDDAQSSVMVEVNCETDFVAKNDRFKAFVNDLLPVASGLEENTIAEAAKAQVDAKITEIGENIVARRNLSYQAQGTGAIAVYVHMGGKFGVMVEVGCQKPESISAPAVKTMLADLTLHITAANPTCVTRDQVAPELVTAEKDIYAKQVEDKPANIIDKIVAGKLEKFYGQICLLEQGFVKEPDKTISTLLAETGQAVGDEFSIRRFVRWQLGA